MIINDLGYINHRNLRDTEWPFSDFLKGGNRYIFPPHFGRLDANYGLVLQNEGNGKWNYTEAGKSGLNLIGKTRKIETIKKVKWSILVVRNNEAPLVYQVKNRMGK